MKKTLFSGLAVLAIAAVAGWNMNFNSQTKGMSDVALANVEALADGEGGLDTRYTPDPYECKIYVGVGGSLKLLGGSIIKAKADGYAYFDGARDCLGEGNSTCSPISCVDIYEAIF